ncbi:MAG: hypothetical protein NT068_03535 [Candidatus Nomurabacteria bacterium]|nr:hypothetical protein [Candidatus Nomurabacteria bacterium]
MKKILNFILKMIAGLTTGWIIGSTILGVMHYNAEASLKEKTDSLNYSEAITLSSFSKIIENLDLSAKIDDSLGLLNLSPAALKAEEKRDKSHDDVLLSKRKACIDTCVFYQKLLEKQIPSTEFLKTEYQAKLKSADWKFAAVSHYSLWLYDKVAKLWLPERVKVLTPIEIMSDNSVKTTKV